MNKDYNVGVGTTIRALEEAQKRPNEAIFKIGTKYDYDKIRMELLMGSCCRSLEKVAEVLSFGAKKYADDNWRKVDNAIKRYEGALHRHLTEYYKGNIKDKESGLDHLAHALCCLIFLYEKELENEMPSM